MHEHGQELIRGELTTMEMLAAYSLRSVGQTPKIAGKILSRQARHDIINIHPIVAPPRWLQRLAGNDEKSRVRCALLWPQGSSDEVGVASTQQVLAPRCREIPKPAPQLLDVRRNPLLIHVAGYSVRTETRSRHRTFLDGRRLTRGWKTGRIRKLDITDRLDLAIGECPIRIDNRYPSVVKSAHLRRDPQEDS